MKKILFTLLLIPALAFGAQPFPTVTTQPPLTANNTAASTAYADSAVGVETNRAEAAEATKAPLASPNFTGTVSVPALTGLGGNTWEFYGTDTGSNFYGPLAASDNAWSPPGTNPNYNNFFNVNLTSSLTGGSLAQRWNTSNMGEQVTIGTTGPAGTPASPSGMADSHTLDYMAYAEIPPGICDGQDGSGFPGGVPGNNCYQEIGNYSGTQVILSPGHYAEGVGEEIFDNNAGSGAVPIRASGFSIGMVKDNPANTYNWYGYIANSIGTQQTTYAPTSAFAATGGWQNGIDLSNATFNYVPILLPGGEYVNGYTGNVTLGIAGNPATLAASIAGTTLYNPSNSSNVLNINATGNSGGAIIDITGNGATTPSKFLQVQNGALNIMNNAFTAALVAITDAGNMTVNGSIKSNAFVGVSNAIVSAAGSNFGSATQLTKQYSIVTAGTPGGVILPNSFGDIFYVWNDSGSTLTVYTPAGATLGTISANATTAWFAYNATMYNVTP